MGNEPGGEQPQIAQPHPSQPHAQKFNQSRASYDNCQPQTHPHSQPYSHAQSQSHTHQQNSHASPHPHHHHHQPKSVNSVKNTANNSHNQSPAVPHNAYNSHHHTQQAPGGLHPLHYHHHQTPTTDNVNHATAVQKTASKDTVHQEKSKKDSVVVADTSSSSSSSSHAQPQQNQQAQPQPHSFQLTTKLCIEDFELKKLIGKGSFGRVWQVEMKKNRKVYALKILKKKDLVKRKQVTHTNTERRILANITHPFLVSLRYAFQTTTKLYMVMDFFNGGELFFHLQKEGKFAEPRACFYAAEICLGIECLHSRHITYRDLKPENILLDFDGHIKITDFGLSKQLISTDLTRTFCGSPEYLAPEMLQQTGYNQMVDWWSFGTILYEMICGLPPFYDQDIQKMYANILWNPVPFYQFMSKASIDLISRLLHKSPQKRIQCADIKKHSFFRNIEWDKCYRKQIEPPFKPQVLSKSDASNFEEIAPGTVGNTPSLKTHSLMDAANQFPNFTYDETSTKEDLVADMRCID